LPGVVRSRVGYCGGTTKNPTYYKIGDHTETLQIEYDPKVISYEKIMEVFWSAHNPCARSGTRQYMTAVFYHNEAQKKAALAARDRVAARLRQKIETTVLPLTEFYLAEDYHQLYYLRNRPEVLREFRAMYPNEKDFRHSSAAMRINGFLGNYGTVETFEKERASYGLSDEVTMALHAELKRRR
jgi:methionine-S-sulfoxide reductase